MSIKCHRCDETVADGKDETLAAARWGWTIAPDPGLGSDAHGIIPGWFYACPSCSDPSERDAFKHARPKEPTHD